MIAFFILSVAAAIGYFVYSSQSSMPFKLGLDLAGGTELVYTADVSKISPDAVSDSMTALRDAIERRVNIFGVSEPVVETETAGIFGSASTQNRLIVELPGVTDIDAAKAAIGATPVLEFFLIKTSDYKEKSERDGYAGGYRCREDTYRHQRQHAFKSRSCL